MSDDPWAEFRTQDAQQSAAPPTDPWSVYRSPGTASPVVSTPGAPQSMTASPDDKYRAAAMQERDRLQKAGIPLSEGYGRRIAQGATLGWLDEIMAGGMTPFEMIAHRTLDPREGYRYAKAREDLTEEETRKNTAGLLGGTAELAGGLATGAGAMGTGARAIGLPLIGKTIPAGAVNWGANVLRSAGIGATAGAGEAKDIEGIPQGLMMGGILGAGLGAAVPAVAHGVSYAAGPTIRALQFPRLRDPVKIADEQIAKVARDAGIAPEEIARRVADANAMGQPYTVADALGNEGARKLTGMSKTPGAQRDLITQAITERNQNMPQRVSDQIGEALGAPGTAEQARTTLLANAERQSAPKYREAEQYPTWSNRLQEFIDDPVAKAGLRQGMEVQRLRAVGEGRPYNPRDAMITDFDAAGDPIITGVPNMQTLHTLKTGIDKLIEGETNDITGKLTQRGAALVAYKNGLLREMDAINPAYAEARSLYRGPMEVRGAVDVGKSMASRGRPGDTVPAFEALPDAEKQGVRIGYADAVRAPLEKTGNLPAILREKSPKGSAELDALSLYQGPRRPGEVDPLRTFLNREEQMQHTSKNAIGGPATAENLADMNAGSNVVGDVAGLIGSAASGNPLSVAQRVMGMLGGVAKGESAAQRMAITRALLERDPDMAGQMAARIAERERRAAELVERARANRQ